MHGCGAARIFWKRFHGGENILYDGTKRLPGWVDRGDPVGTGERIYFSVEFSLCAA
jgi:hypothetical protein